MSVQSPARYTLANPQRVFGRRRASPGDCVKVARRSLTTRYGGRSRPRPWPRAAAASPQVFPAIAAAGSAASAPAALTVIEATSPRTKSHCAVPPIRPRNGASGGRRAGSERRKWTLTMALLSRGTVRDGTRAAAAAGGTARITLSPSCNATHSAPKSRWVAEGSAEGCPEGGPEEAGRGAQAIPRSRRPNRTVAPHRRRSARAGTTNAWESPSRATRGRQAASPLAKVSRRTGHSRRAEADRAGVFSAATASGSQNRSNSTPPSPTQSATVRSGPAAANRRAER